MTKTLTFLFATTALTAALGLPVLSAMHGRGFEPTAQNVSSALAQAADGAKLILIDDDEDDEEEGSTKKRGGEREDDDDDDDDDDGDDCEEDEGSCGGASNPAPAGSAAPPQNGLFGNGTAPKATVN